jgi:hypothetical protein
MRNLWKPVATLAITIGLLSSGDASQARAEERVLSLPSNTTLRAPVTSYTELRFKEVVRQRFDLSCGAAALATLMRYGWGLEITEEEIIEGIATTSTAEQREKIRTAGFSLLELKRYGERRGFAAAGFRVDDVRKLADLRVPAITLTDIRGYKHFAVIKGVRDGRVFVADPAFGNRVRTLESFDEEWNNVILVFVGQQTDIFDGFTLESGAASPTRELVMLLSPVLNTIRPQPGEF